MARNSSGGAVDELKVRQRQTPLADALDRQRINRLAHFDVPAHKSGRGNPELTEYLGERALAMDVNSMKPLDNLGHPVSVIKEAQQLAAEAFGADDAFFMVNGTTSAVQAMIMSTCSVGDEIILPRNVHRSAINALVVCGAVPIYVNPGINRRLGIPLGMSVADVEKAIAAHPSAKAILVNNPTYYGICSDLRRIVEIAHKQGRDARPRRRGAWYALLFSRGPAYLRDGCRVRHGGSVHPQNRRLAYAKLSSADASPRKPRLCAPGHYAHAVDFRFLSFALVP